MNATVYGNRVPSALESMENIPAKRVNVVSVKLVRESSFLYPERQVKSPGDVVRVLRSFLEESDREKFVVLCLDTRHQPTAVDVVSVGHLNATLVHPREVFKSAILSNAAAVVLAHNHPSAVTTPSNDDKEVDANVYVDTDVLGYVSSCVYRT